MKDKGNTKSNEVSITDQLITNEHNQPLNVNNQETPPNERTTISKTRRRNQTTGELMTIEETDKVLIESYNKTLQLIIDKGYGVTKACKLTDNMNLATFFDIVRFNAHYLELYTRSQELRAEKILDRMDKYVHSTTKDTYFNEKGVELPNAVKVQRNRLMYDMDKWHLSKLNPKKYGDNITVKGDADNPLQIVAIKGMIIQ